MKRLIRISIVFCMVCISICGCGISGKDSECKVTIEIRCDTAIANGMNQQEKWKGILPDDGCILKETEIALPENSTVFDALCAARDEYKIHMEYSGGKKTAYIEGIGNLYERDGGRWSGWMYNVNGQYPDEGCSDYILQNGDRIQWNYTCDLGADLKAETEESEKWKEENE